MEFKQEYLSSSYSYHFFTFCQQYNTFMARTYDYKFFKDLVVRTVMTFLYLKQILIEKRLVEKDDIRALKQLILFIITVLILPTIVYVVFFAFLPLWLAISFALMPMLIISYALGVLSLAIINSFNPYYQEKLHDELEKEKQRSRQLKFRVVRKGIHRRINYGLSRSINKNKR